MTQPLTLKPAVQPSPLQSIVADQDLRGKSSDHLPSLLALARQIEHNLQYQHAWTDLVLHTHSPLTSELLPRPLLSGLPPQRLYVHPDEQIELLKQADEARKARNDDSKDLDVQTQPEREWILPTRLSEKWSLRRLSAVFDGVSLVPPAAETAVLDDVQETNPWRTAKRVVLASADTDSTVVYYIVHDGVVKPRQN